MEREQIIRMAQEASILGSFDMLQGNQWRQDTIRELERFAALVISHHNKTNRPKPDASEREWLQQIAYQHGGIGDLCQTEFEFGAMVAAAEREACAKVCDVYAANDPENFADICAAAIRARGKQNDF